MRLIKAILFCLCMCSFDLYAQVNVTGIVNDNTGETLPGVSILAKDGDRTYGTTTDDCNFLTIHFFRILVDAVDHL